MKLLQRLLVIVSVTCAASMGLAQNTPPPVGEKIELSTESEAYQIGLLLRCPVCQGMPIADSPADMAQAMMKKIRTMTDEGRERQEILDYFVSRYGEWVLLEPKQEGLNWVIWLVPPIILVLGLLWAMNRARQPQPASASLHAAPQARDDSQHENSLHNLIRESVDGDDQ